MADKKEEKTPIPPELFLPVSFWGHIVSTVDFKAKEISSLYGYGKVTVTFKIHRSRVSDIFISDSVQIRNMYDKDKTSDSGENLTKDGKS